MLVYILRLIIVVLNDKNCIFRHKFYDNFSKSQFYENADENSIYVSFVFHLTISTLRHVYSVAYDRFNWYDGIRYSYISFCAKSASISLVDFSMDIVASKKSFLQKLKVELNFISAIFTFDKNMKSCIFSHSGIISLVYLFVCMYISYKAHNRCTKETFLIGSDVDVNIFSALRSIPSGTIDINLKSCILNRHKLRQSQIATLSSQFVICRNLWSRPWRGILTPITLITCSGYLGEYPCSHLTWIWKVSYLTILLLFQWYICSYVYHL